MFDQFREDKQFRNLGLTEKNQKGDFADVKVQRDNLKENYKYFDQTDKEWFIMFNFHDVLFGLNPRSKVINIK